jgi:acetyl esterase/lipase
VRNLASVLAVLLLSAALRGAPAPGPGAAPFRILKDISYQSWEPANRADLYLPVRAAANWTAPAIVWMHGNNHDKGDARERNVSSDLARAGYVCLNINYGTWPPDYAGEEESPRIRQNIVNAKNAVRFLRVHAAEYHVDRAHLALFGGSAGAWLSLLAGFTGDDPAFPSSREYPGVSCAVSAIGDFYGDVDGWLESTLTAAVPPVLIVHGKLDPAVNYSNSVSLDRQLTAKGVPHQLVLLENVGHSFDFTTWKGQPLPIDLRPVVLAFLQKYLGPPAPPD